MMLHYIKKEVDYGIRSGKFLVLLAGFLFFALLTPVMLRYVLPGVLSGQGVPPQELSEMQALTQADCIHIYMNDVFEMGTILVVFTLCGLMAQEIRSHTLVLPLCAGKRYAGVIFGKLAAFGSSLLLILPAALVVNALYSGLLFTFDTAVAPIIRAGSLQGVYMCFLLSCAVAWGSVVKKSVPAGFLTLATGYGLHVAGSLFSLHAWLPSGLLVEAQRLAEDPGPQLPLTLAVTVAGILGLSVWTWANLKRIDWNRR